jgi:hypothetical protein
VTLGAWAILATASAALFLYVGGRSMMASGGAGLGSRLFLFSAAVAALCVVALGVLCGALWAAGASARQKHGQDAHATHGQDAHAAHGQDARAREDGSATLEFALILPIALMFVLVMTQSSLVMGGNLCANYSAFCAARTAIVVVPRDFGVEEPRNVVGDPGSSSKLRRIHLAAVWAVLPVSCTHPDGPSVNPGTLQSGLEAAFSASGVPTPPWVGADLGRRLAWAQEHTTVELAPPANRVSYEANEDLRVSVRHDFYLSVPYASKVFSMIAGEGMEVGSPPGQYALTMRSSCRLTNEGEQDFVDVEQFPRDRIRN